jgi:hypothetical protein
VCGSSHGVLPYGLHSPTFAAMSGENSMYQAPRLERYGTFRELTQFSLTGALGANTSVLQGTAASCDCLPTTEPVPTRS